MAFKDKDKYLNFGFFAAAGTPEFKDKFEEVKKEKEEILAALEQSRWNGFMLSRGWESATVNQVQAYKEQSTGFAHKHILAKLHPFIREWEDLNDPELEEILGMLKSNFKSDKHPQETTRKGIRETMSFFKIPSKEKTR